MSELRQAAQAALDALESDAIQRTFSGGVRMSNAAIALRAALAQPPSPTAQPVFVDSTPHLNVGNSAFEHWFQAQPFATQPGIKQISRDSYAAGMGDPLVMAKDAQPVQQPGAEPDGRLHADGYFTWKRRDGYVLDAKLPCDFYLAAPAQRQPLSDEEIEAIWKAHVLPGFGERQRFYSPVVYARAIESAHGIAAQKGEKL